MKTWHKLTVLATVLAIIAFGCTFAYYYFTTNPRAVVVECDDFPSGVSAPFTPDAVIDRVVAHLDDMITTADSSVLSLRTRQDSLAPGPIRQTVVPIPLTPVPSPVFNQVWKGLTLNLARRLGISLRVRRFLEIELIGVPQGGWRLTAYLKERPKYFPVSAGSAPHPSGPCVDLESCANELGEQVLRILDSRRLLNYYIKLDTQDANQSILDLYGNAIPSGELTVDDFVAWGNAYFRLQRYDDALEKYQRALENDNQSYTAHLARGLLYYSRPHETHLVDDLGAAERDFKWAISQRADDAIAQGNLCSTLIREWANSSGHNPALLTEAKRHCDRAIELDPHLVAAAVNIGYITYRSGRRAEALRYFENLSQKYPTDPSLFVNYGFFLYREYLAGNTDALSQAVEKTLKSWTLNPHGYVAANNLGFFYYEQQDFPHALEFWERANLLVGDDADCLAGLALGKFKSGDQQGATAAILRAIRVDSHYRDPNYLKNNNDWSDRAAGDLAVLLRLVPS